MGQNIVQAVRATCWSTGRDSQRETSRPQQWLEENRAVFCLQQADVGGRAPAFYLHVGFVNYKTWQMSVLQLHAVEGSADDPLSLSVVDGLDVADLADLLNNQEDQDFILGELSASVRTLVETLAALINFDAPHTLQFFKLVETRNTAAREMPAGYIFVRPMPDTDGRTQIWQGSSEEAAKRKRVGQRKRKRSVAAASFCWPWGI